MNRKLVIAIAISLATLFSPALLLARGFGGGGHMGGGGFGGGGFGGGGFGGGGFGGGGFGGGGFGGGGGHGDFGGGGGHGDGGFGGGGFGGGGGFRGGDLGGGLGAGGLGGGQFGAGGAGRFGEGLDSGLGGRGGLGGQGLGGQGLGGQGLRGAGGPDGLNRGGQFGGFGGGFGGTAPTAARLNSFLGLPTDSGLSAAGGHEFGGAFGGSARGLNSFDSAAAGHEGASGGIYHGPDGTTIAHGAAGERGGVVGPNGAAAGERGASGTVIKGPDGGVYAHGQAGERGIAAGPGGVAGGARGASGTVIKGPDGGVYAHGEAGGRGFYDVARGAGTWHWSAADGRLQGNYVRTNFNHWNAFDGAWYRRYPNAWWARGFADGFWTACSWGAVNDWFGVDWVPVGYYYGDNVTYVDNNVCLDGQPIATAADYYQSAAQLAQTGEEAEVDDSTGAQYNQQAAAPVDQANAQWLPLGVFEAIPAGEKSSNMTFQLAVNKDGIVRGNYFNTGDNNVQQVQGAVDKQTQRVTWVVTDRKNIIFDTGLYNLTKDETSLLVHEGADKTQQWTLVRLKQPPDPTAAP